MKIDSFCSSTTQMSRIGKCHWSVPKLIQLSKDLPVMEIPLDHMNIAEWYDGMRMRELVGHMKSVNNADLKYPIILDEDGEIMDGRHRLMKALLTGKKTIKAVRFEVNPTPCKHDDD